MSGNPLCVLANMTKELCHCVTYQFDTLTDLVMPEKKLRAFSVIAETGKHTQKITSICTHKKYCACHTRRGREYSHDLVIKFSSLVHKNF